MGFGRGAHFCIGATLARLEVKIFIESLLESFDQFKLKNDPIYLNSIFVRRFISLDIEEERTKGATTLKIIQGALS